MAWLFPVNGPKSAVRSFRSSKIALLETTCCNNFCFWDFKNVYTSQNILPAASYLFCLCYAALSSQMLYLTKSAHEIHQTSDRSHCVF